VLPDGLFSNQKIQIWVNFGGSCNERFWCIIWTLGPFYSINYILWSFGIGRGNLVYFSRFGIFTKKNLATLLITPSDALVNSLDDRQPAIKKNHLLAHARQMRRAEARS
jgi:hypothetical protein